jgi:PRC-barrel domain
MPAFDVVRTWKQRAVLDRDGHPIGTVIEVYYDAETDQPGWALLDLSAAGGDTSFVPVAEAREEDGAIRVPYERAKVLRAPGMPPTGRLWPQDEAALYHYYGLTYTGASLVDLDELEDSPGRNGRNGGSPSASRDAVRVGPAVRWLLDSEREPS